MYANFENIGLQPRDLFGAKELRSEGSCDSPYGSMNSSFDSAYSMWNTPIQPEKNYPLNIVGQNNDGSRCPEVNRYIANFIKEGDDDAKQFVNYQYDHNLFSPFNFYDSAPAREPLGNIQPFSIQRKLAYTECVKDNRKDFSFVYNDKKWKEAHKDHMLFNTFNDGESEKNFMHYSLYSPLIMPPSPTKTENCEKVTGFKTLFKDDDQNEENENLDTKWILDILGDDKDSPEKFVEDTLSNANKNVSSKAHLKSIFSNAKFTSSKAGLNCQQVTLTNSKKLNFESVKQRSTSRKLIFGDENKKEECIQLPPTEKAFTPAPIKFRKAQSDSTYNKETIIEVSKRLQDEMVDNPNSPSKEEYKNFAKDVKEWEKDGFATTMK